MSASSLSNYVDIDRLIDGIKLAPQKQGELQMHLKTISNSLLALKAVGSIVDEVRTIELLLESISKKLAADGLAHTRLRHAQSLQRDSSARRSNISPVKQFEEGSRIVYANFSIKEMMSLPQQPQQMETPIKRYHERQESEEMDKLNNEILVLEKMLQAKGVASNAKPNPTPTHTQSLHPFMRTEQTSSSGKGKPANKENSTAKKYSLLEKTQEINLARPRPMAYDRNKLLRAEHNYR
jgi:hypothetical protein